MLLLELPLVPLVLLEPLLLLILLIVLSGGLLPKIGDVGSGEIFGERRSLIRLPLPLVLREPPPPPMLLAALTGSERLVEAGAVADVADTGTGAVVEPVPATALMLSSRGSAPEVTGILIAINERRHLETFFLEVMAAPPAIEEDGGEAENPD